jgi:hypothetical protein
MTPKFDPLRSESTDSILAPSSQFTDSVSTHVEARHSFFDPATFLRHCFTSPYAIREKAP